ncbi:MAG: hypothetical protein KDK61_08570, partial [Simkania sp.]|nr:hypothetical protein [Simkania sp.]
MKSFIYVLPSINTMKWFVFLVGVVLLSSFALAAYEDVLGNNEAYLVDTGELYFKKPFIAYEGTPFDMVLLPDINQSQVDLGIEVYKEGKILPKTFSSVEFENETKVILVWGDVITKDTSYTLVYKRDGRTLFRQPFTIQAKEKIVVDRTLQESTYFPTKITDNQREYLLELLSNKGLDYTLEDFSLQEKQAKEVFSVDKKVYIETAGYFSGLS